MFISLVRYYSGHFTNFVPQIIHLLTFLNCKSFNRNSATASATPLCLASSNSVITCNIIVCSDETSHDFEDRHGSKKMNDKRGLIAGRIYRKCLEKEEIVMIQGNPPSLVPHASCQITKIRHLLACRVPRVGLLAYGG